MQPGWDDNDCDIYIMMQCLCVCHKKSSLPTSELSAGGVKRAVRRPARPSDDDDDVIMDEVGGAASLRRLLNGECCDSSSFFVVGPGGQGILKHIFSKVRFIFLQEHLLFTKQMLCKKWGGGAALNTSKK